MVRFNVNSLRKTVESKRQGILELNLVKECLKQLQEKYANKIIVVRKAWFPLSQLRPRQRPILSENKPISVKDDSSTL